MGPKSVRRSERSSRGRVGAALAHGTLRSPASDAWFLATFSMATCHNNKDPQQYTPPVPYGVFENIRVPQQETPRSNMPAKQEVDYTLYLREGETLESVKIATLRKRKEREGERAKEPFPFSLGEKARLEKGREIGPTLDAALFAESKLLQEQADRLPRNEEGSLSFYVEQAVELQRAFNYQKSGMNHIPLESHEKSKDDALLEDGQGSCVNHAPITSTPYAERRWYPHWADCMMCEVISETEKTKVTPEFSNFLVRLIESYFEWVKNQRGEYDYTEKIQKALNLHKSGRCTGPKAKEPEPKPEPAEVKERRGIYYKSPIGLIQAEAISPVPEVLRAQAPTPSAYVDWSALTPEQIAALRSK